MRPELIVGMADGIVMLVSLPLVMNKVPKNRFYGVRTRRTLAGSEAQWYQVNHAAGIAILASGAASLVVFAAVSRLPILETTAVSVDAAVLVSLLLFGVWFSIARQG